MLYFDPIQGAMILLSTPDDLTKSQAELFKTQHEGQSCTCAECPMVNGCEYAWDDYNTNGDCLYK